MAGRSVSPAYCRYDMPFFSIKVSVFMMFVDSNKYKTLNVFVVNFVMKYRKGKQPPIWFRDEKNSPSKERRCI